MRYMAVGQNQWSHFVVGEITTRFRTYFSGIPGMFTGGYDLAFDPWPYGCGSNLNRGGYAGFGPCSIFTRFHFGTGFLSHSYGGYYPLDFLGRLGFGARCSSSLGSGCESASSTAELPRWSKWGGRGREPPPPPFFVFFSLWGQVAALLAEKWMLL